MIFIAEYVDIIDIKIEIINRVVIEQGGREYEKEAENVVNFTCVFNGNEPFYRAVYHENGSKCGCPK